MVLAVLGLLAAAAPPLVSRAMPALALDAAARDLAGELRRLRATAIATAREQALVPAAGGAAYVAGEGDVRPLPAGARLSVEGAGQGGGEPAIRFFPDGSSSGGTLKLEGAGTVRRLGVAWATGLVTVAGDEGARP